MSADDWRRCSPEQAAFGYPQVMADYARELAALAQEQGLEVDAGVTLTASYECVDGKWYPKPETIKATRS